MAAPLGEFELIARLLRQMRHVSGNRPDSVVVGAGDDAAVLRVPADRELVVTTDTLVAGVHFPVDTSPGDIGHKALAVNLSDLAAMGGEPAWFFLALTLPAGDADWLDRFAAGMAPLAEAAGIALLGGDTTSGPLSITVTALGLVQPGAVLLRSTASAGDAVVVSGTPGLAASALRALQAGIEPGAAVLAALNRPQPRLALGRALHGLASACIDVSDGLAADLGHILESSGLGAELWLDRLPWPQHAPAMDAEQRWELQLGGGDDYELCFTVPPCRLDRLAAAAAAGGVPLSVIGRTLAEPGLRLLRPDGRQFQPGRAGFDHFRGTS